MIGRCCWWRLSREACWGHKVQEEGEGQGGGPSALGEGDWVWGAREGRKKPLICTVGNLKESYARLVGRGGFPPCYVVSQELGRGGLQQERPAFLDALKTKGKKRKVSLKKEGKRDSSEKFREHVHIKQGGG